MSYVVQYIKEAVDILEGIDKEAIDTMIRLVIDIRAKGGRLFFLGVGGSAANCTHAVNDFRKIGGMECYTPVDNVAELTARTNDEGWHTVFSEWLACSQLNANDGIFVLSVGVATKRKMSAPTSFTPLSLLLPKELKSWV